ncbi:N-acetyltransferase [Thermococcus sp.]|uniref:GNAT family N-acetyltransferase n=1 Tax=Thermococcus sp. TaxID=35749 RepID=UPI0026211B34|nr:N-acetyltransferase [Thermococcus sp.]
MIEDKVAGVVGIASKEERSLNVTPAVVLKYRGIKFLKSLLLWQLIKSMPGKGDLFIEFIAVESRYRGRGIGTKLLNRAIAFACENGLEKVRLFVRENNTNARKLYKKTRVYS